MMTISVLINIFSPTVKPLQLLQSVRAIEGNSNALERVIIRNLVGEGPSSLLSIYGDGVALNDQLDAMEDARA